MKMRKQRLLGGLMMLLSGLILALALTGQTTEERDITPLLFTLPLGLYMLFTHTAVIYTGNPPPSAREPPEGIAAAVDTMKRKGYSMARKRVIEKPALQSWEDVNDALRQIAEAQIIIGDIESDMQKQVIGAQKVAEEQAQPYRDSIARLERELKAFVTEHREELGKGKSRTLTFGEVGFRLSTSISLPRAKEKLAEVIRRLKSRQMTDCIEVEERVSREALKKYGEDTVNAVGATWKQSDVFGYDVNIARLEQMKQGS